MEKYHIYDNFLISYRFLIVLVTNILIYTAAFSKIFDQKRSMVPYGCFMFVQIFIYKFLIAMVLQDVVNVSPALQLVYCFLALFCSAGDFFIMIYTFRGDWVKIMLTSFFLDMFIANFGSGISSILDFLEGRNSYGSFQNTFLWADCLYAVIMPAIYLLLCHKADFLFDKYRAYRLKARNVWAFVLPACIIFFTIWWLPIPLHSSQTMSYMVKASAIQLIVALIALARFRIYLYQLYTQTVEQQHAFLKKQQIYLMEYQSELHKSIHRMEENQQLVDAQIRQLARMECPSDAGPQIRHYLDTLKKQDASSSGLYCGDWSLDAALSHIAGSFRKRGIQIHISAADYHGRQTWQMPTCGTLLFLASLVNVSMPGSAKKQPSDHPDFAISLTVGTIRNLTVIRLAFPWAGSTRQMTRQLRNHLKPYDAECFLSQSGGRTLIEVMLPDPAGPEA